MPFIPDNNAPKMKKEEMRSLLVKRATDSAVKAQQAAQEAAQNATLLGTLTRGAKKVEKVGDFLGVSKFGRALGTSAYLYGTKDGRNLRKKAATGDAGASAGFSAVMDSAPSNKEIVGSAALTGLNMLGGGVLKGAKAVSGGAQIARGTAQGAGYGIAGGMEQNKDTAGIVKQGLSGAALGGGLSALGVTLSKTKDKLASGTKRLAENTANTALRPTSEETKKAFSFGKDTIGKEIIKRGISGTDEDIFNHATKELNKNEDILQRYLKNEKSKISKTELTPYFKRLIGEIESTPGMKSESSQVKKMMQELPNTLSLPEANRLKRKYYNLLDDKAFKLDASLTTKKEGMKTLADALKREIERKASGKNIKDVNKELGFFLSLKDRALDNIGRNNKNNQLGLSDLVTGAAGAAGGGVVGAVGTIAIKRFFGSTKGKTVSALRLSKLSENLSKIKATSAGKISKAAILNAFNNIGD